LKEMPPEQARKIRNEARRRQRAGLGSASKLIGPNPSLEDLAAEMRKASPPPNKRKGKRCGTGRVCRRCGRPQHKGAACNLTLAIRNMNTGKLTSPTKHSRRFLEKSGVPSHAIVLVHPDRLKNQRRKRK
jgi:hypothetical protein